MEHTQVIRLRCHEKAPCFEFKLVDYPQISVGESLRIPMDCLGTHSDWMGITSRFVDGLRGRVVLDVDPITLGLFSTLFVHWKELNGPNAKLDDLVYTLPDIEWPNLK